MAGKPQISVTFFIDCSTLILPKENRRSRCTASIQVASER